MRLIVSILAIGVALVSCQEKNGKLPIWGQKEFIPGVDKDTVYHTVPEWSFTSHRNVEISSTDFNDIYVAYYFFASCPSICPAMTNQLVKVQDELKERSIPVIGHTVDPKKDTVESLNAYAEAYGLNYDQWHLVTGEQETLYELGVLGYLVPNQEDALAPGGFLHSEMLILVDDQKRIRGMYDGTLEEDVKQLLVDIDRLKNE